ncbi:hypothetical protein SAMN05216198_1005 [Halopseudomonas litoralis]|uniref:Bacteriophage Rz lysis protein n=1 Tax=Halopseudomonas litoralis TaxID=797277 RepID=A0A1H1NTA6_9GAMM|nr:hypothetical protein [Halopseudomonas litoralis]SDS02211.1 hypothetical protein SAMN05216198_1005 [Halopseudomonas litoralis]
MNTIQILTTGIGLFTALVIVLYVAREAYTRGQQASAADRHRALVESRKAAAARQRDFVRAMEDQSQRHQEELLEVTGTYARKFKEASNAQQEAEANSRVLRDELRFCNEAADTEVARLRNCTLTQNEIQLLEDMAGKLRLSGASLHATQQFADAREARELALRGDNLVKRLRPKNEVKEDAA